MVLKLIKIQAEKARFYLVQAWNCMYRIMTYQGLSLLYARNGTCDHQLEP